MGPGRTWTDRAGLSVVPGGAAKEAGHRNEGRPSRDRAKLAKTVFVFAIRYLLKDVGSMSRTKHKDASGHGASFAHLETELQGAKLGTRPTDWGKRSSEEP